MYSYSVTSLKNILTALRILVQEAFVGLFAQEYLLKFLSVETASGILLTLFKYFQVYCTCISGTFTSAFYELLRETNQLLEESPLRYAAQHSVRVVKDGHHLEDVFISCPHFHRQCSLQSEYLQTMSATWISS